MFKISLLRSYHVKYYDYFVNWRSGIACDWCASLDIALKFTFKDTLLYRSLYNVYYVNIYFLIRLLTLVDASCILAQFISAWLLATALQSS